MSSAVELKTITTDIPARLDRFAVGQVSLARRHRAWHGVDS
jgi:hypothetical protein